MCHVCPHTHTSNPREKKIIWRKAGKWQHNIARLCLAICTVCFWGWAGGYNRASVKKCSFTLNIICCVELLNFLFPLDFSPKSLFFADSLIHGVPRPEGWGGYLTHQWDGGHPSQGVASQGKQHVSYVFKSGPLTNICVLVSFVRWYAQAPKNNSFLLTSIFAFVIL